MADSSSKFHQFISCTIVDGGCKPYPSISPQLHVNFNFSLNCLNVNWVQDQDSIRLVSRGDLMRLDDAAVANLEPFSVISEIREPIEKALEHEDLLSERWRDQLILYAWDHMCQIGSRLIAGCYIVDLDIHVVIVNHIVTTGENAGLFKERSCCLCLEDYISGGGVDKLAVGLPCSHVFHLDCAEKWLKTSSSCPLCRHDMLWVDHYLCLLRGSLVRRGGATVFRTSQALIMMFV